MKATRECYSCGEFIDFGKRYFDTNGDPGSRYLCPACANNAEDWRRQK